jgi:hypothetical protein
MYGTGSRVIAIPHDPPLRLRRADEAGQPIETDRGFW